MSIQDRKHRQKEKLRQEILDAARELFVEDGYENVSMRKIAERIEYSPTTIYLYFNDKSEILHEIFRLSFAKLNDEIIKSRESGGTPLEVLRRGMMAYIEFGLNNPYHYDAVYISPKSRSAARLSPSIVEMPGIRAFELLTESVTDCIKAGLLGPGNPAITAQTIWSGIHGATSLMIKHKGFPFAERHALSKSVVDTMIRGLRK
jgi:AcrR family transcriptional regulator